MYLMATGNVFVAKWQCIITRRRHIVLRCHAMYTPVYTSQVLCILEIMYATWIAMSAIHECVNGKMV